MATHRQISDLVSLTYNNKTNTTDFKKLYRKLTSKQKKNFDIFKKALFDFRNDML